MDRAPGARDHIEPISSRTTVDGDFSVRRANRKHHASTILLLLCTAMVICTGCGGSARSATTHVRLNGYIHVSPHTSLMDQPVTIRVTGLPPGGTATIYLDSFDDNSSMWSSSATYQADSHGTIELDRAAAVNGSYSGVDAMGLIESMAPATPAQSDQLYHWSLFTPQLFTVKVRVDTATVASTTFWRRLAADGVTEKDESLSTAGFIGRFWIPSSGTHPRPAVLDFGGSEGGLDSVGANLASHDYPTLDLAYFKEPGLPASLATIPLEYFARALTWLSRQPQVDLRHIYVAGGSRGSEAALLLGVYYPNLVHGVIATSPSNVAICSYPGCMGPAWTLHGRAIPYTTSFGDPNPTDNPQAVIPVERIRGPIFLACGGADQVWPSCVYAQTIMARLNAHHDPYRHLLFTYPAAGHGVDTLVPYEPEAPSLRQQMSRDEGLSPLANADAHAQVWPRLLAFLA